MYFSVSLSELLALIKSVGCCREDVFDRGKSIGVEVTPDVAATGWWIVVTLKIEDPEGIEMWVYGHVKCHRRVILYQVIALTVLVEVLIVAGITACLAEHCSYQQ